MTSCIMIKIYICKERERERERERRKNENLLVVCYHRLYCSKINNASTHRTCLLFILPMDCI